MKRDVLAGTKTPRPPAELKERVLRAARTAAREAPAPARSRWGFTRLDLAWVAGLLVLVAVNVMLSISSRQRAMVSAGKYAHDVPQERIAGPEDYRDLIVLRLRLDTDSRHRPTPTLSLEQALRAGS